MPFFVNPWLLVHIVAAILAVVLGAWLFRSRKGTRLHRHLGIAYIGLMLVTNLSIMPVQARVAPIAGTGFGIFHVLAAVSLASLIAGMVALWRWHATSEPGALRSHQINLAFSYLGLIMALGSELVVNRNLGFSPVNNWTQFWILLAAVNIGLYVPGFVWIMRSLRNGDPLRHGKARG